MISDTVLKKAIAVDQKYGISNRFKKSLEQLDKKTKPELSVAKEKRGPSKVTVADWSERMS
ncbi:hypothetical protein LTS10_007344 [Elasticomyces elasticus]|nr:hypothetical protein LTS10_007344 [Elasticomyces elasticus]